MTTLSLRGPAPALPSLLSSSQPRSSRQGGKTCTYSRALHRMDQLMQQIGGMGGGGGAP